MKNKYFIVLLNVLSLTACIPKKSPQLSEQPFENHPVPLRLAAPEALGKYVTSYHYQLAGDYENALKLRREAVQLDSASPFLLWSLSDLCLSSALSSRDALKQQALLTEAKQLAESAVLIDPRYIDAHRILLRIAAAGGDFAKAIEITNRLLELEPDNIENHLELAKLHLTEKKVNLALETLDNLIRLNPMTAEAWSLRGAIFQEQGSNERAEADYKEAIKIDPKNETYTLQLSEIYGIKGLVKDMEDLLVGFTTENPAAHESRYRLASLYAVTGRLTEARNHFTLLMPQPFYANLAVYQLAQIEIQSGNYPKALEYLELYRPASNDRKKVDLWRAYCHEKLGEWNKAETVYDSLRKEFPEELEIGLAWIRTMLRLEKGEAALDIISKEAAGKDSASRLRLLGNCLLMLGRDEAGIEVFQDAITRFPNDQNLHFDLAVSWEKTKQYERAIAEMEKIVAMAPENAAAHNFLGYTLADRNLQLDKSYTHIRKALDLEPDNGAYVDSLGWWYYRKGQFEAAVKELERALNLVGEDPVIAMHLGDAYNAAGNPAKALELWRKSFELEDTPEIRQRLQAAGASLEDEK